MQYKIIVDKQPSSNPSLEKKEYIIDIEELRIKGNIYDSLNIEMNRTYVTRRLSLSKFGVLSVLDEPQIEELTKVNIELFEGDNYIYLMDMQGNGFYAEYLIKNDFNDIYVTKNEMNSSITQTAQSIELSVNQKLEGYSTTEEMNSTITQTAQEINSEVSKKVGEDEIISKINQSAEQIQILANKLNILGKKVKFETEINSTYNYTSEDLNNIQNYIMGEYDLTDIQRELYDINKDGKITASDYVLIRNNINSEGNVTINGSLEIDPDSASRTLILRDSSGNIATSVGLLGMETENFSSQYIEGNNATIDNLTVTNSFSNNSDRRLKEDIKDLEDKYISLIKEIKPVKFKYKKSKEEKIGFIAQDVETALKKQNLINTITKKQLNGFYSLDYIQLIPILWKVIQEQQETIEKLQGKISKLEQTINSNI